MTHDSDLDRVLGEWLAEGPVRAPEQVIGNGVQHARAHPRRPDPLRVLRRDPMGSRSSRFAVGPVPVMAVLGLLLVAAVGVMLVGGQRTDGPPVVPEPTPGPSADASVPPSAGPEGSPRPTFPIRVGLQTGTAAAMVVAVTDGSGLLVDARSGAPTDGGSVPAGVVQARNVDERTLLLAWTDAVCDIEYALDIETTTSMTLTAPPCVGDALALDRRLLLQFAVPVDAGEVDVRLASATVAPGATDAPVASALPEIAATRVAGSDPPMTITLRGDPAVVTGIREATDAERTALAAETSFAETPLAGTVGPAANELVLAWVGGVCDVSATLTVESTRIVLTEGPRPACDAVGIGKGVVVTFAGTVDPAARELLLVHAPRTP